MFVWQILQGKGKEVVTVLAGTKVADLVALLKQHRIGAVMVTDPNNIPKGVFSERDLTVGLADYGAGVLDGEVDQLMTTDLITCTPHDTVQQLMEVMTKHRVRHLPVLDNDEMAGIISVGDVVKSRLEELETEASELQGYIRGQ
ncbi:MAG: CBS domain-containing protein [Geminicoccaceae bacterium]